MAATDRKRLFFALWPDTALRARMSSLADALAATHAVRGRKVPAERLHMTLLFLGDVSPGDEARILEAAAGVRAEAFELRLDQAGSFFRSRVLWLGARQAPRPLTALWLALRERLFDLAIDHNRLALAPHVTCFRDIDKALSPEPIESLAWPVKEFVLVHSTLGAQPRYHVVSHWPLQTARA